MVEKRQTKIEKIIGNAFRSAFRTERKRARAPKVEPHAFAKPLSKEEKERLNKELFKRTFEAKVEDVKRLLEAGADVDARDDSGETPLIRASAQGHLEVAKLLIRRGADVNARDGRERDKTVLMTAALMEQPEFAKLLIDSGADVHARDKGKHTAIWNAVYNREIRTIELLLDKGADVNARDKGGGTPLHWAAFHPRKEVIELLLQRGADVHAVDNDGETPLFSAATGMGLQYRAGIIELLAKNGASLDHHNKYGNTPLWRAARKLYAEPTEALLRLGADASRVARHFAKTERILKSKDPAEDNSFMALARVLNGPIISHLKRYGALKQDE